MTFVVSAEPLGSTRVHSVRIPGLAAEKDFRFVRGSVRFRIPTKNVHSAEFPCLLGKNNLLFARGSTRFQPSGENVWSTRIP